LVFDAIMRLDLFGAYIKHKYGLTVMRDELSLPDHERNLIQMGEWCEIKFGDGNYTHSFSTFYFNKESHRNLFILRWT
jgi:hypothetical protein